VQTPLVLVAASWYCTWSAPKAREYWIWRDTWLPPRAAFVHIAARPHCGVESSNPQVVLQACRGCATSVINFIARVLPPHIPMQSLVPSIHIKPPPADLHPAPTADDLHPAPNGLVPHHDHPRKCHFCRLSQWINFTMLWFQFNADGQIDFPCLDGIRQAACERTNVSLTCMPPLCSPHRVVYRVRRCRPVRLLPVQ
jgi:hypothetical protein